MKMNIEKIWSWIEKNRFTVLCPVVGVVLWIAAVGCTPTVQSPVTPGVDVSAVELEQEFLIWQKENEITVAKFEAAGKDLERQAESQKRFIQAITTLASGSVADFPGLVNLLLGSGIIGLLGDNIRKNGVIGGLKAKS